MQGVVTEMWRFQVSSSREPHPHPHPPPPPHPAIPAHPIKKRELHITTKKNKKIPRLINLKRVVKI